jgi:hypothetical protein
MRIEFLVARRSTEIESWERRISNLEIIVTSEDSELPTPLEDYAQRIENLKIPKVLQRKDWQIGTGKNMSRF